MTSQEIIKNQIAVLKKQAQIEKELKTGNEIYCEIDIEQYNQVLKDLEDYEELKNLMGTPIQDIMKRLKVLDILKRAVIEDELFKLDDDGIGNKHKYILVDYDNYHVSYITSKEYELLKEWLDGKEK